MTFSRTARSLRPLMAIRRDIVLQVAIALCCASRLAADPVSSFAERWRWREFDVSEGLSSGSVAYLHQAANDFIYAATDRGLCRYDLHFWEEIESLEGFEPGDVVRMVDSTDSIFCATRTGLWVVRGGRTLRKVYPESGSRQAAGDILVAAGKSGEIFLIDEARRLHLRVREPHVDPVNSAIRLPSGAIRDYRIDASGVHWLVTSTGIFSLDLDSRFLSWREADSPADSECQRILSFRRPPRNPAEAQPTRRFALRQLWGVFSRRRRDETPSRWFLARLRDESWEPVSQDLEGALPESITVDGRGNHYATCEDGRLLFLEAGGGDWARVDSLWRGPVKLYGVIVDSRGNLWFRQGRGGVAFFNVLSRRWQQLPGLRDSPEDPYPNVLSLLETATGELWVGTQKMGIFRYRRRGSGPLPRTVGEDPFVHLEETPVRYEEVSGQVLEEISALGEEVIVEDVPGRVWVGSQSRTLAGAYYFDLESETWGVENGRVGAYSLSVPIQRIVTDGRGELWYLPGRVENGARGVVFRRSVYTVGRFEDVEIVPEPGRSVAREIPAVNDLLRSGNGSPGEETFWLATEGGLLGCRLRESRLEVEAWMDERDGLFSSRVWAVAEGPDDGSIWICYPSSGSGVTRIEGGQTRHFDVDDGLASSEVWSIARSGPNLWFGTRRGGLSRYDGQCWYSFPVASATPEESHVYPIVVPRALGNEDSLIIGTWEQGVLLYRADDMRKPRVLKRSFPERFRRNDSVAFRWRARDYKNQTLPEHLIYRYRLDEGDWKTARGIEAVSFGQLAVGRHIFELEVRDLDGYQNWRSVSHEFEVHSGIALWPLAAGTVAVAGIAAAVGLLIGFRVLRSRRAAYQRYRGLYLRHPHAVFVIDRSGRICDYNGRSPELLGLADFRREDILNRPLASIPALASLPLSAHVAGLARGSPFVLKARSPAGSSAVERVLEVRGYPMAGGPEVEGEPRGEGRVTWGDNAGGGVIEVEDRTEAEESLRLTVREKRLRGLRDLASRVATDLEALVTALEKDRVSSAVAAEGGERLDRLRETLRGLKAFCLSGVEGASLLPLEIDALLERLLQEPGDGAGSWTASGPIRVDYRSQTGLWAVLANPSTVEEALRAVLRNAFQALSEGGLLTVRAGNIQLDRDPGALPAGGYVEVLVADDGPGMDASQLETIFDPFYSTKPRDLAEGIGLSVAYGLVRSQGGDIRIDSRPGEGTRVRLLLPASRSR